MVDYLLNLILFKLYIISYMMEYLEFLKLPGPCPFCNLKKDEIIFENDFGKIILSRAPYHKNHILIIPNKHVFSLNELNDKELCDLHLLERVGIRLISKKYSNYSILYREGLKTGKSVNHLHINIIPELKMAYTKERKFKRYVYTCKEYVYFTNEFKKKFC